MRKTRIFISGAVALLAISATSCTQEYKDQIANLKDERRADSVKAAANAAYLRDSLTAAFNAIVTDISFDLENVINEQGSSILSEDLAAVAEGDKTAKQHLKDRIDVIRQILDGNERKIDQLATTLEKFGSENEELQESLDRSRMQFEDTRQQLATLEMALEQKSSDYDKVYANLASLKTQNDTLNMTLRKLDKKAFSGYYVVGSFDELKDEGVLTKEGGILSIGATPVLRDEFAADQFRGIDIRETRKIPINSDKYELVTSHPESAYEEFIENEQVAYLEITNPEEFWKSTKYMVVQVK